MKKENDVYDYQNCQSLFGYAMKVHERSGGICLLCCCGASSIEFDLWRQMTVEHLIGRTQGGYIEQVQSYLAARFPKLSKDDINSMASAIDEANTITACSFCNSTTSHTQASKSMYKLIDEVKNPDEIIGKITTYLKQVVFPLKKEEVDWKLESIKKAFQEKIEPGLHESRVR